MKKIDVAVGVIIDENKILLTQRNSPKSPSTHLKWQLPGGGVEENETIEKACIRELKEETGYLIEILGKSPISISNIFDDVEYVLHGFKCKIISGTINIQLDEETNDAKWFELDEIKKLKTLSHTYELVKSCVNI